MKRSRRPVKIQDVARAAGVSVSTVSRVLNDKDDVSEETYLRVRAVIEELGYVSSLAARGMRSHRTNVIGLILPDVSNPYTQMIMRGVNRAIAELEQDLLIYTSGGGQKENLAQHERAYVTFLNGGIADGVIVVAPTATVFSSHAPVVIIDPNNESPDFPAVLSTNYEGALAAMKYLISIGHRRIGHITGRMELMSSNQRLQGYKDALTTAGIPVKDHLIKVGDYTTETAVHCAQKLLSSLDRPTAIFAANDLSAIGIYQAAKEAGLRIPQDLSVIGFDNLTDTLNMVPPLTTVDQYPEDMGTSAIEMILTLINNKELTSKHKIYQTQLVIRESCSQLL